jgi:RNA polymerase sigma-70 factor, ECF subfamily
MDSKDLEARELMQRYARGEDAVFEQLYARISARLYRFCQRLARNRTEGDDYFQETLLRLHRARATYRAEVNPLYWAFAIARSVHLTHLRYGRRRPEAVGAARDAAEDFAISADDRYDPQAQTRAQELAGVMTRTLQRMSEKNRAAYILLREEELSVKDAATTLGITQDAVRQRAHRADVQLRAAATVAGWASPQRELSGASDTMSESDEPTLLKDATHG